MNNDIKLVLNHLLQIIIDEAEQNEEFANKLENILMTVKSGSSPKKRTGGGNSRPANRRDPAVLDPLALFNQGEEYLAQELSLLSIKQLKDIIADYSMDTARLCMKWKDKEKLVNHILDTVRRRATRGDAFRS